MEQIIFYEGQVVQLKSGGPKMTIERFAWDSRISKYSDDRVHAVWFDVAELKSAIFDTVVLKADKNDVEL